jgi:hypothetical protein
VDGGHDAWQEQDVSRRNAPSIQLGQSVGEDFGELDWRGGVAEHPVIDSLSKGLNDRFRRREVHVRDPHGEDIGWIPGPLDAVSGPAVYLSVEVVCHGSVMSVFSYSPNR